MVGALEVVVTSPYLRCVETAAAICTSLGSRTRLMVDLGLGEVYGPEIFGEEPGEPGRIIRSSREVEEAWRHSDTVQIQNVSRT